MCYRVRLHVGERVVTPIIVAATPEEAVARARHLFPGGEVVALALAHPGRVHRR
jgi:hypothetical protein